MSTTTEALFLSAKDITDLAEPAEFVNAVRDAYVERGNGAPTEPRTLLRCDSPPGRANSYTAVLPDAGVFGGYTYSSGFPSGGAWMMTPLFDTGTGEPLAVIDGEPLGPLKTGAVGAVGVDALAKEDATTVGVIGSGRQAWAQIEATRTIRDIESVMVYSRSESNRTEFAELVRDEMGIDATAADTSADAVSDADIVITATKADDPVFDGRELSPGTHVTAMGRYHPYKQEIDDYTVANATYVPDLRDRAKQDAGAFLHAVNEGVISENHIHAELGDVVVGRATGRTSDEEITVFDSGGTAIETVAAANLVYRRAVEAGLGTPIEFEMS